jgi:capsular polysaccharide biosynthesis protein
MDPRTKSSNVIWRAKKIDNNTSLEVTSSNVLDIVRTLRADVARQEQLLGQIMAILQQSELSRHSKVQEPASFFPVCSLKEVVIDFSRLTIRQVEKPQGKSQDIVARLKATAVGQFYVGHLKQIPFLRGLIIWAWRNVYPLYVNHIAPHFRNKNARRWRPLIKLSEYAKTKGIPTIKVMDAALVETPPPKVFPAHDQKYLSSPHDSYNFPPIYVAKISNGIVYGGTNLVMTEDGVICHDLYDFERDYTSEELHGRHLINAEKCRMRWLLYDEAPELIPAAATFVDACASNYAHWLTEVLPRIAAFCSEEKFKNIPLVINEGLHKNIMESLCLMAGPEREIITLPIGRALQIDSLYLTSVAGYVPFDRRNNKRPGHSHGIFSPAAFELIRKQVWSFTEELPKQAWPEKIYLRRNSGVRKVTNAAELEALLVSQGYAIVEPEKLTFLQQVQLFRAAKEIVSPTGAALSNAIFAKPGTRITIIMARHENMIYRYWLNMLAPVQINVFYVLGNIIENHHLGIHADFSVDAKNIDELIKSWKSK